MTFPFLPTMLNSHLIESFEDFRTFRSICNCDHLPRQHPATSCPSVRTRNDPGSKTRRYTTLHYTTLHYTTLHYTTLHYTTQHYTTQHYTTLQYNSLHHWKLGLLTVHDRSQISADVSSCFTCIANMIQ